MISLSKKGVSDMTFNVCLVVRLDADVCLAISSAVIGFPALVSERAVIQISSRVVFFAIGINMPMWHIYATVTKQIVIIISTGVESRNLVFKLL